MRERISESSQAYVDRALKELAASSSVNRLDTVALGTVLLLQWTPVLPGIAATYSFHPRLIIRTRSMERFQDACKRAIEANRTPRPASPMAFAPEPPKRQRGPIQRRAPLPEERRAAYLAEKAAM